MVKLPQIRVRRSEVRKFEQFCAALAKRRHRKRSLRDNAPMEKIVRERRLCNVSRSADRASVCLRKFWKSPCALRSTKRFLAKSIILRNIPWSRVANALPTIPRKVRKEDVAAIWRNKGTRFAYRSAICESPTIARITRQISAVNSAKTLSDLLSAKKLAALLDGSDAKTLRFSSYQILLDMNMVTHFRMDKVLFVGTGAAPALQLMFYPNVPGRRGEKLQKLWNYVAVHPDFKKVQRSVCRAGGKWSLHAVQ